jgi:hypothetical protein
MAGSSLALFSALESGARVVCRCLLSLISLWIYPISYVSLKAKMSAIDTWRSAVRRHLLAWFVMRFPEVVLCLVWLWCVESVFDGWGLWPVVAGVLAWGIGILPVAATFLISKQHWADLTFLCGGFTLSVVLRLLSHWIYPFASFRKLAAMKKEIFEYEANQAAKK